MAHITLNEGLKPEAMTDTKMVVYTGAEGDDLPSDVVCLRVDPSVALIPANAFYLCSKPTTLCEGLVEIGDGPSLVVTT